MAVYSGSSITPILYPPRLAASSRNISSPEGISGCSCDSQASQTSRLTIRFAPEHITAFPRLAVRMVSSWIAAYSAICKRSKSEGLSLSLSIFNGRIIRSAFVHGTLSLCTLTAAGSTTSSSWSHIYSLVAAWISLERACFLPKWSSLMPRMGVTCVTLTDR